MEDIFSEPTELQQSSMLLSWHDKMENVLSALGLLKTSRFDWQWTMTTRQARYAVCYADIAIIASLVGIATLIYFGELLPILK